MSATGYDDPALLKRVQRATARALAELDRVCAELGLEYAAYGGTAIGAARHQGFIPWDDDVDVVMPRPDYERLLAEADRVIDPGFVLLSSRNSPDYPKTFGVLGLAGTAFIPEIARNRAYRVPIGVDIFPLDVLPDDERAFKRMARRTWVWGRLMYLRGTPTAEVPLPAPARQAAGLVLRAVHWGLRAARVSPRALYKRWDRSARSHEGEDSVWLGDFSTQDPRRWSIRRDELLPTIALPFEGMTIRMPRAYDAVLTRGYGDYMAIPPVSERVNHKPSLVDFGDHDFADDAED